MESMDKKLILNPSILDSYAPSLQAILGKLVSAGFKDIQLQIDAMNNLNGCVSQDVMVRSAHSIKSCSAQVGGELLSDFALEKEQQYISGQLDTLAEDITIFSEMFDALKSEMVGVLAERGVE